MVTDHHSWVSLLYWFNYKEEFAYKMSTQVLYLIDFVTLKCDTTAVNVLPVFYGLSDFFHLSLQNLLILLTMWTEDCMGCTIAGCRRQQSSGQSTTTTWELEDQLKQQLLQIWNIFWALRMLREDTNNLAQSLSHRMMLLKITSFWMWTNPCGVNKCNAEIFDSVESWEILYDPA